MITHESIDDKSINYLLKRAVEEVIIEEEMVNLLRSGKKLRLKEGFDPSAPDIHLGHMVTLRKMRQFQDLGHQIVLIVADWTAQIGDPSGASATRKMLSAEQVRENAETYLRQFFKIVDKGKTELRWQSEWFGKFDLAEVIRLTSKFTVAQFLARDDFNKRYNEGRPIAITELLYPLLQAYDSVAVQADVEVGGIDQKFNFLVGRELQSMMGQHPQQCFMTPVLVGTDGVQKMSKSLGNYIGIAEPANDIYGKTMSIRDDFIIAYFDLLTDVPNEELAEIQKQLDNGVNPMSLKKHLAREIVTQLYSIKEADEAEQHFEKVIQKKEVPNEIEEYRFSFAGTAPPEMDDNKQDGKMTWYGTDEFDIRYILVETKLAKSRSEATRLIQQGAISINGERITSNVSTVESGSIIKAGKRRFVKVINTDRER